VPPLEGIASAGGWVVCVATLLAILDGFRRGYVVPGHVYDREVKRGDRLEAANERLTRRIAELGSSKAAANG
jgi:hypothetical protein